MVRAAFIQEPLSAMRKAAISLILLLFVTSASAQERILAHPHILVETSVGDFKLELDTAEAPHTVRHFLELVEADFYNGLIFHRVIPGFMVQGGGYTPGFEARDDEERLPNESGNALSNVRGTIAMARTNDPHSANSQFFINVVDNDRLDPQKGRNGRWGYTVFGVVFEGMEVVDKIAAAETSPQRGFPDAPVVPIVIERMSLITY